MFPTPQKMCYSVCTERSWRILQEQKGWCLALFEDVSYPPKKECYSVVQEDLGGFCGNKKIGVPLNTWSSQL